MSQSVNTKGNKTIAYILAEKLKVVKSERAKEKIK